MSVCGRPFSIFALSLDAPTHSALAPRDETRAAVCSLSYNGLQYGQGVQTDPHHDGLCLVQGAIIVKVFEPL
jgi:hypothetical protein